MTRATQIDADLQMKSKLWKGIQSWQAITSTWESTAFKSISTDDMEKNVKMSNKIAIQAGRLLPTNEAVDVLRDSVETFKETLPCVRDLRNESLKERHWKQIHDEVGFEICNRADLTLGDLMEKNIMQHSESITTIATEAQQESVLEEMLQKVTDIWKKAEFEAMP